MITKSLEKIKTLDWTELLTEDEMKTIQVEADMVYSLRRFMQGNVRNPTT